MKKLPKLKYEGEECCLQNRSNLISYNQRIVLKSIMINFGDEFIGKEFGKAWDFIKSYIGREYLDKNGTIQLFKNKYIELVKTEYEMYCADKLKTENYIESLRNPAYNVVTDEFNYTTEKFIDYDINPDDEVDES